MEGKKKPLLEVAKEAEGPPADDDEPPDDPYSVFLEQKLSPRPTDRGGRRRCSAYGRGGRRSFEVHMK